MFENRGYLLVLDVGTGSGRAILFSMNGELIAFKGREWQYDENPNYRGALDFDVEANWLSFVQSIREVMAKTAVAADEVKAISITSMRHGMVCYDGKGCSLAAYPNAAARAEDEAKWPSRTGIAKQIYKIGGWKVKKNKKSKKSFEKRKENESPRRKRTGYSKEHNKFLTKKFVNFTVSYFNY